MYSEICSYYNDVEPYDVVIDYSDEEEPEEVEFINLTPHAITIVAEVEPGSFMVVREIPASGKIARCNESRKKAGAIAGIPVYRVEMGKVENLPDPMPGKIYIVSRACAEQVPDREDVLIPDQSVRDNKGSIVGCKGLAHV